LAQTGRRPMTPIDDSYRKARRVALLGIGVSSLLACGNIVVGFLTGSTSVAATGFAFAGDVLASSIIVLGMRAAMRPPDDDHPYGHGRFETLSAFGVGVILLLAGVSISYQSLDAIGARGPSPGLAAVVVLIGAIAIRSVLSIVKFRVGRRLRSSALIADAWNDAVDILSAAAALTAVALAAYDPVRFVAVDHYGGGVVGLIVMITGVRVLRDASLELVDTMPAADLTDEIRRVAAAVPRVAAVEKLFARKTGLQYHVDVHIEVDPHMTVSASHEVASGVRSALKGELPWIANVLVHIEPARRPRAS
jgi:cation diffusion facilitator family transporter